MERQEGQQPELLAGAKARQFLSSDARFHRPEEAVFK
jgi:hypothetical protein